MTELCIFCYFNNWKLCLFLLIFTDFLKNCVSVSTRVLSGWTGWCVPIPSKWNWKKLGNEQKKKLGKKGKRAHFRWGDSDFPFCFRSVATGRTLIFSFWYLKPLDHFSFSFFSQIVRNRERDREREREKRIEKKSNNNTPRSLSHTVARKSQDKKKGHAEFPTVFSLSRCPVT